MIKTSNRGSALISFCFVKVLPMSASKAYNSIGRLAGDWYVWSKRFCFRVPLAEGFFDRTLIVAKFLYVESLPLLDQLTAGESSAIRLADPT